jgi:hypothetical protein
MIIFNLNSVVKFKLKGPCLLRIDMSFLLSLLDITLLALAIRDGKGPTMVNWERGYQQSAHPLNRKDCATVTDQHASPVNLTSKVCPRIRAVLCYLVLDMNGYQGKV